MNIKFGIKKLLRHRIQNFDYIAKMVVMVTIAQIFKLKIIFFEHLLEFNLFLLGHVDKLKLINSFEIIL
jgi:hypothetical protein